MKPNTVNQCCEALRSELDQNRNSFVFVAHNEGGDATVPAVVC